MSSGRGGHRENAGRKIGSTGKLVAERRVAAKAAAKVLVKKGEAIAEKLGEQDTPLEILVESMLLLRDQARILEAFGVTPESTDLRLQAVEVAAKAAPYMHAKLANIEANITGKMSVYEASLLELTAGEVEDV